MAVPFDTPVSAIEGIGPAVERLRKAQGVYTVYDLLRAPSPALHAAVSAVASLEEVSSGARWPLCWKSRPLRPSGRKLWSGRRELPHRVAEPRPQ